MNDEAGFSCNNEHTKHKQEYSCLKRHQKFLEYHLNLLKKKFRGLKNDTKPKTHDVERMIHNKKVTSDALSLTYLYNHRCFFFYFLILQHLRKLNKHP